MLIFRGVPFGPRRFQKLCFVIQDLFCTASLWAKTAMVLFEENPRFLGIELLSNVKQTLMTFHYTRWL